ncbi:unnamed protein product [Arctia plantaginis]|uniref:BED-type domain-containing protein n=1 Tax=Arctia plantaginis TaxID=874455 RepID=A0A8S1B6F0_ARCPL|nr:unnamed protein product [Arctia plantaginis]
MRHSNAVWEYFEKVGDTKKAICRLCDEEYSFISTTGNLKSHLKKKHEDAYLEVEESQGQARLANELSDDGKERVIYEYVVAQSPTSSVDETANSIKTATRKRSRDSKLLASEYQRKISQHAVGKAKAKRLIEELTEEKICVAHLQKELIEKEMEEKNLKITLLQEEMKHKKEMYDLEKQEIEHRKKEMEHKKQMNELEKREMLLKIEVLKANLRKINETDLPLK